MPFDANRLREQLQTIDLSGGLTRDQIRERLPELPSEAYMYLPAAKKFYNPDEVLRQTGPNALARAEGDFVEGDGAAVDALLAEAAEDEAPAAFGHTLTASLDSEEGSGDYPGPANDLGGNSLETRAGRGVPDDVQ